MNAPPKKQVYGAPPGAATLSFPQAAGARYEVQHSPEPGAGYQHHATAAPPPPQHIQHQGVIINSYLHSFPSLLFASDYLQVWCGGWDTVFSSLNCFGQLWLKA